MQADEAIKISRVRLPGDVVDQVVDCLNPTSSPTSTQTAGIVAAVAREAEPMEFDGGKLSVLRNSLLFAPIAVTWFGLWDASRGFDRLGQGTQGKQFLDLWINGFDGNSVLTFNALAFLDVVAIALVVVSSLAISVMESTHLRKERLRRNDLNRLLLHLPLLFGSTTAPHDDLYDSVSKMREATEVLADVSQQAIGLIANLVDAGDRVEQALATSASTMTTMTGATVAVEKTLETITEATQKLSDVANSLDRVGDSIETLQELHMLARDVEEKLSRQVNLLTLGADKLVNSITR